MKTLLAHHELAGPADTLEAQRAANLEKFSEKTLGTLHLCVLLLEQSFGTQLKVSTAVEHQPLSLLEIDFVVEVFGELMARRLSVSFVLRRRTLRTAFFAAARATVQPPKRKTRCRYALQRVFEKTKEFNNVKSSICSLALTKLQTRATVLLSC